MSTAGDAVSIIHAFDAAWNRRDVEAIMAFFADDAVLTQVPSPPGGGTYRGNEQIRGWVEPQLPGFHVDSRDFRASGDTVTWMSMLTGDLFRQMGFSEPIEARGEAVVREGKIASLTVTNPPPTPGPSGRPDQAGAR
jgi:ketosteroid isomerase-like protein